MKQLDLSPDAPWRKRFNAPRVAFAAVASQNPARGVVCTNRDGIYQLYAWDVESGDIQQRTFSATGMVNGVISADGESIYYLQDESGNEVGHWVRVPFTGGDPQDITPDMPPYASFYLTETHSGNLIGFSAAAQAWGFRIYVQDHAGNIKFTYENSALSSGPNLSHDGTIAVIATTEKSGTTDFMLEAYDIESGMKLGEVWDGEGTSVQPIGFIPRPADERYLAQSNASGYARPFIWEPRTGQRRELLLNGLRGEVNAWDWSEDGRYLLLVHLHQAKQQLYIYDLEADSLIKLAHPSGTYSSASFVGAHIHAVLQSASRPAHVVELDRLNGRQTRILLTAGDVPQSAGWRSITYNTSDGTPIQAWLLLPPGDGPFPTIVHTHGGPTAVLQEMFMPDFQAWVDHGFAVLSINYRGSTTFGRDFQKAINGNLGDLEVEDIAAGVQWLLDEGLALPDSIIKTGRSYGGYLTLQTLGKKPDLWAGGMAVVAIADWALMYEDQAQTLRGYQRALFGGTPDELPEAHRKASPITYAENVNAELLVIQGRNDTRCPSRQMEVYLDKMENLGKSVTVEWYDAGHSSRNVEEQIQHMELMLRFAYRILG